MYNLEDMNFKIEDIELATLLNTGLDEPKVNIINIDNKLALIDYNIGCVIEDSLVFLDEFEWSLDKKDGLSNPYVFIVLKENIK